MTCDESRLTVRPQRAPTASLRARLDLDQNNKPCDRLSSAHPAEWRKHLEDMMTMLKGLTIVAALLVAGASLAMAQNGPATGGEHPVAGGAAGGGPAYGHYHHRHYHHRYWHY